MRITERRLRRLIRSVIKESSENIMDSNHEDYEAVTDVILDLSRQIDDQMIYSDGQPRYKSYESMEIFEEVIRNWCKSVIKMEGQLISHLDYICNKVIDKTRKQISAFEGYKGLK